LNTICILIGGKDYLIKDRSGKEWKFEDHPYCGPIVLDKKGDPKNKQPKVNSLFWESVNLWYSQGKKINECLCVYENIKQKKPILKHKGGRHYEIIGYHD